MIGQQLGPYTIEAELGSGGMGTVYRAAGPDGVVALKVVHPHLLATPGSFKRFLREAEIGKAVRHENVVRTMDVDALLIAGQQVNFMVLEYVEGRSLRALLRDLGTIPETLLREIALQAAAGLAAIHAQGIVHRDLKPENVLITDDHEIRIMDLGVAKLQEATVELTKEGQFAGSLLYAAPEQFRGDAEVGPASDLYSLGVLLYELATGDHPFRRDDHAHVIHAHLNHEPRRLHERTPKLTRFFSELVARLLEKDPARRFESAGSLQRVLERAERSIWWRTIAPALDRHPVPALRVGRETRFHGREVELESLRKAWERAKAGEGNTVWIAGEAGIGKTRLLAELIDGVRDEAQVLYGSYPPTGGLSGFFDAIRGRFGDAGLEGRIKQYLPITPLLVPAFAALVRNDVPPEGAEPVQGDALHAVGVHLMRGMAAERPTIWVVDDLHFAPREGRDLALSLARAAEGHPVLLILTARPGVPGDELAHFDRLDNFRRIELPRLSGRQIVELLEDAFRSEALAEKLGVKIVKKSDGIPFFVFQMIRGLKEGEFIRQDPDGAYVQTKVVDEIEVPSAVKDLIEGRLRGLSERQRAILDVAAVQGVVFDPDLMTRVLEEKRVHTLRGLAEIERRHGLVRGESGYTRFDQNQVQEVIYQSLPPDLRAEYHTLLAGACVDRLGCEPSGEDAAFVVSHHLRGNRPSEGLPHLMPALAYLKSSYRNETALELADRALGIAGLLQGRDRFEVLLSKGDRHGLRGERQLERASLDEALALADEDGDAAMRARVRQRMGEHLIQISDYPAAWVWSEQARDLAREAEDRRIELSATGQLGIVRLRQGRCEEARAQFERSLALARQIGDREGETRATGNLGFAFSEQGRHEEARVQFEKSLDLARGIGDRRAEAVSMGHLGIVFLHQGRFAEARAQFEKHLALSRGIGDRRGEAIATGNLGVSFFDQNRYEEARQHYERHLALSRAIGDRAGEARATGNLGIVLSEQGRYGEARARFEKHLALSRGIGDLRGEAVATGNLGLVCQHQGHADEARGHYERHLAVAREVESRRQEAYALCSLASLADAEGDREGALQRYGEALALRRELGEAGTVVETLVALGGSELEQGRHDRATAHLDEALSLAQEAEQPAAILLATVSRARLAGGDVDAALETLGKHEERVGHSGRMNARFRLWELTGDHAHLEEAKRLLDFAVEHSPEECRESMIENVPLHRDISRAWEEYRAS